MPDLKPGDWIAGEYRIRQVFGGKGKSGMGVVYLVEDRTSDEPFVLKTFQRDLDNDQFGKQFLKEAEAWIRLGAHPNLVRCCWAKNLGDQMFVAAEYISPDVQGKKTLADYISGGGDWASTTGKLDRTFLLRHAARRELWHQGSSRYQTGELDDRR